MRRIILMSILALAAFACAASPTPVRKPNLVMASDTIGDTIYSLKPRSVIAATKAECIPGTQTESPLPIKLNGADLPMRSISGCKITQGLSITIVIDTIKAIKPKPDTTRPVVDVPVTKHPKGGG